MNTLLQKLSNRPKPINVVIIGLGAMGKGLFYQCTITPGVRCLAVADLNINKCMDAANMLNQKHTVVNNDGQLADAINNGSVGLTENGMLLAACEQADVVIEASNAIADGAKFVLTALRNRKHVVLMNAEIDL